MADDRGGEPGIAADELLIVSALDRSDHCAARALLLFALFVSGSYGRCHRCGAVGTCSFDHVTASFGALEACDCGGAVAPVPVRRARMYLSCGPWSWSESTASPDDELHLPAVRAWLGLESSVLLDDDLAVERPRSEHELIQRLAAADVILLPHDGTATPWALTVERRDAIPTVATGFGTRRDAPNLWLTDYRTEVSSTGSVRAHMDTAAAMDALEAAAATQRVSVAIVVAPHTGRSTGFTTVATNVASALGGRGWDVNLIGTGKRFGRTPPPDNELSYELHNASSPIELVACLDRIVRAARPCSRTGGRHPVVVFGRVSDARLVDRAARWLDLRSELELTYYMAVDYAPLPAEVASLAAAVDHVVPSSQFGAHALAPIGPAPPIPHGVDIGRFRPLARTERARVRRDTFGVDDDALVISYFGRNSGHKRPDLALRAVAGLIRGTSASCRRCGHVTAAELNANLTIGRVDRCRRCLADELDPTAPQPNVVLYMHIDITGANARRAGGWDLQELAEHFEIANHVMFCTEDAPIDEVAKRMAASDIHVLLQECGGWELTVLETGACGVPNVITDVAAPPEYAAPFSIVVPVGTHLIGPFGARGQADLDAVAVALRDLACDRDRRSTLGWRGVEVAASYSWDRVGDAWAAHFARATGAR